MNEHDATEIAFNNGYTKAVREIFEEIERLCDTHLYWNNCSIIQRDDIIELKKKYTRGIMYDIQK